MRFMIENVLTEAEAKSQGFISLADAATKTGEDRTNLWRKAKNKQIASCLVKKGSRSVHWVLESALGQKLSANSDKHYETLKAQFFQQMRSGAFTGKPESKKYVEGVLEFGLKKYWAILDKTPSLSELNAENFNTVMDSPSLQIDEINRRDYFSTKTHIYRACTRFIDFLTQQGLKTKADKALFKAPRRHFKPQKRALEEEQIQEALNFNKAWYDGRKQYDVDVMELLIHLYAFAGLRRMEAASLRISDIDFKNNLMIVFGKGSKERYVPLTLFPDLKPKLEEWINHIRPKSDSDILIEQFSGSVLTESSLNQRFTRLRFAMNYRKILAKLIAEKGSKLPIAEIKEEAKVMAKAMKEGVRPHDLRRACATILAKRGMPMSMIQLILGHEDLKTTQGYVMTNIRHVMDWTKENLQQTNVAEVPQISRRERLKSLIRG